MMKRRSVLTHSASLAALATLPAGALAQGRKDSIVYAMALEPSPGLDPTGGAASSIAEVTLYNIYETLTKINPDGSVTPLLAESWEVSPDLTTYTFKLRRNVKFQNGEPFNAQAVKFSFDRAGAEKSTNKDKRTFAALTTRAVDEHTVVVLTKEIDPDFPFLMGQATAVIVEPKSADTNMTKPVGTGPYVLENWVKGSSITLKKWDGYRNAGAIKLNRATFRFIADPAAQVAAMLAGDVDAFPRITPRSVEQFKGNNRFQVVVSGSRAKTILALNDKKKPFDDVRVRRALNMAIDRKAVIQGAGDGYGVPIGSYYPPSAPGYVDLTSANAYNPDRARALLKEAGVTGPVDVTITLPPPPYARQGGEVIASQLAKVGFNAKLQNVEWAQWLSNVYGAKNYDMTIISHVEPFDLGNFAKPDYYWNYQSQKFNDLYAQYKNTGNAQARTKLLADIQRMLADDAPMVFLYQPQWVTVANRNVRGLWRDMPIFVNDLSSISWA
ncbi:ABC transporter substrate-binding protein [Ramlibacter sp. USB13]|uniref:ABC transporter substrate-binding protein n=1 Tax=Ramlibacter cellulosilyticus TaxID=2764187 RepID=A0A923SHT4_9BURK|nr:ABC transporter substrate-binding protein [Ramlibacter cellulosilyticus]MBC5786222.1 ABC transporter substrate-binding protein [Ramlibacter cellulosilyticus]